LSIRSVDASVPPEHLACSSCLAHVVSVVPSTSRAHGFSRESESRLRTPRSPTRLEKSSGPDPERSVSTVIPRESRGSSEPLVSVFGPDTDSSESTELYGAQRQNETFGFLANPHGALRSTAGPAAVIDQGSFGFRALFRDPACSTSFADVRSSPTLSRATVADLVSTPRLDCLSYC
jgi:hypothetical protein